jgi:hypothetical protein
MKELHQQEKAEIMSNCENKIQELVALHHQKVKEQDEYITILEHQIAAASDSVWHS